MGNFEEVNPTENRHSEMIRNIKKQNELAKKQYDLREKSLENEIEKYKINNERQKQLDRYNYEQEIQKIEENKRNNDLHHKRENMKINNNFRNNHKYYNDEELGIKNIFIDNMRKEFLRNDIENNKIKLNFVNENYRLNKESMENKRKIENEAERKKKNYDELRKINYLKNHNEILEIDIQEEKDKMEHLENMQNINDNYLLNKLKMDNEHIIKMKDINNDYEIKLNEIERKKMQDGIYFMKNL